MNLSQNCIYSIFVQLYLDNYEVYCLSVEYLWSELKGCADGGFFFLWKVFFFLCKMIVIFLGMIFFFLYPGGWLFFRRTVICLSVIAARNYVAYCSLPSGKMTHGGPLLFCTGSKEPSYTNSLTTTPPDLSKWHILLMAPASLTVWIEHRTRLLPWRFRFRHRRGKKSRVIKMCHHRCHY